MKNMSICEIHKHVFYKWCNTGEKMNDIILLTTKHTTLIIITCKSVYRMMTIMCGSDYHNVQQFYRTLFEISAELSCFEL